MILKSLNKYIIFIFILIPLFSCSNIDFLNKEDLNIAIDEIEIIEKVEFIEENNLNNNLTYYDFYNRNNNYKWKLSTKLEKIYDISIGKKSELIFSAHSNIILIGQYAYYVDSNTKFNIIDLKDKKNNTAIKLEEDKDKDKELILPTTLAKYGDNFFVTFGNGTLYKLDNEGNKIWNKNFNTLLRTPIKIMNDRLIILFSSNKIISIDVVDGNKIWEFDYNLDKPSLSSGGQLLSKYNIIYFSMPNGRIGAVDSLFGEIINLNFFDKIAQKNILNFNYENKLHIYNNILSLIEEKNTLHTYDINNNDFFILNKKNYLLKSIYFLNNSLLSLNDKNLLKSINLKNNKIFWKIDLSKFLSKEDVIIEASVIKDTIILFFASGKIFELNKLNGELLYKQDLNLSEIEYVTLGDNFFIFHKNNGKSYFYKQ